MYFVEKGGRIRVRVRGRLRRSRFCHDEQLSTNSTSLLSMTLSIRSCARKPQATSRLALRFGSSSTGRGTSSPTRKARVRWSRSTFRTDDEVQALVLGSTRSVLYFGIGDGGGEGSANNNSQPQVAHGQYDVNRRAARAQMMGFGSAIPGASTSTGRRRPLHRRRAAAPREEIDFTPRSTKARPGTRTKSPSPAGALVVPVHVYGRTGGRFTVPGARPSPMLRRHLFLFGDFASGSGRSSSMG